MHRVSLACVLGPPAKPLAANIGADGKSGWILASKFGRPPVDTGDSKYLGRRGGRESLTGGPTGCAHPVARAQGREGPVGLGEGRPSSSGWGPGAAGWRWRTLEKAGARSSFSSCQVPQQPPSSAQTLRDSPALIVDVRGCGKCHSAAARSSQVQPHNDVALGRGGLALR
jgi:hypothetical protein